jgi:hypothetical protein
MLKVQLTCNTRKSRKYNMKHRMETKPSSIHTIKKPWRGGRGSRHASGERPSLCQILTSRRCRAIRLHLRRRRMPSRIGLNGIVPSKGVAAHPIARVSTQDMVPRIGTSTWPTLHTSYPQTSSTAAPTTHHDTRCG